MHRKPDVYALKCKLRVTYIVSGMDSGTSRNKGLCNGMDVYTLSVICELQISTSKDRIEDEK